MNENVNHKQHDSLVRRRLSCSGSQNELSRSFGIDDSVSDSSFVEQLRSFKQQNVLLTKNFDNFKVFFLF